MKLVLILSLSVLGVATTLFLLWLPAVRVSPVALLVALVVVRRGRTPGLLVGLATGVVLDWLGGTPVRWVLALPLSAVLCDALHQGVLSHPATGVPAMLAGATSGTATAIAGILASLVPRVVGAQTFGPGLGTLLMISGLAALEAFVVVTLGRWITRLLHRMLDPFLYARKPL